MIVDEVEAKKAEAGAPGGSESSSSSRRRSRFRKVCSGDAEIEVHAADGSSFVLPGRLIDLSDYGAGVETSSPLGVGARVTISSKFFDTRASQPSRRKAEVVHCRLQENNVYRSGCCFEMDEETDSSRSANGAYASPSTDGAFTDYYEILQISSNADQEMIQRVYRLLAARYHPDNTDSGNEEAFRLVSEAFRVLSDPEKRAAYDVRYRAARSLRWKIFTQPQDAQGPDEEKRVRWGILSILYSMRKKQPEKAGVSMKELEDLLGCPREHLEFSIWYLRGKSLISAGDSGRFSITPEGVDAAEEHADKFQHTSRPMLEPAHTS